MNKKRIWLSLAQPGGKEMDFVQSVFNENWITAGGPFVDTFEKELQTFLHTKKEIVGLNSGTSAIHLALIQLGIRQGDEVICQSLTFVATVNPIRYLGANPVFVDSEKDTWNMCPVCLEETILSRKKITGIKPKAIIFVDLYGMPAKIKEIKDIAQKYEIPLIEDAAEALGSIYENDYCGNFGDYAILSFNGNKIITTSAGGALICPSTIIAKEIKNLSSQARDEAPHYQHSKIGFNYRMSNVCAAIGSGQMIVLNDFIKKRRHIHHIYVNELHSIKEIEFQTESPGSLSNRWLTCILLPSYEEREKIRLALDAENIESRPVWKPMQLQPVFAEFPYYGKGISDDLFERGLCLPSGSGLDDEDIMRVCNIIKKTIKSV